MTIILPFDKKGMLPLLVGLVGLHVNAARQVATHGLDPLYPFPTPQPVGFKRRKTTMNTNGAISLMPPGVPVEVTAGEVSQDTDGYAADNGPGGRSSTLQRRRRGAPGAPGGSPSS